MNLRRVLVYGLGVLLLLSMVSLNVWAQQGGSKKKKTDKFKVAKEETTLDEDQQKNLAELGKAFDKLFGWKEPINEEDQERFQLIVWNTVNGTYQPERELSNKLTNNLIEILRDKKMEAKDAHQLVKETAELLGQEEQSKESLDTYLALMQQILAQSLLPAQQQSDKNQLNQPDMLAFLDRLIRSGKKNEEKAREREIAKKKEEEKKAKEDKAKAEQQQKKDKSKGSGRGKGGTSGGGGAGGSSGGPGGSGGRGGAGGGAGGRGGRGGGS